MNIHYKIVEVWPSDHLIVARYWTDVISEQYLDSNQGTKEDGTPARCRSDVSITLPTPTPTGVELEKIILNNAPLQWLKTLEHVFDPNVDTEMEEIKQMLNVEQIKSQAQVEDIIGGNSGALSDDEIQRLIEKFNTNTN